MPVFLYKGVERSGAAAKGTIEADSQLAAAALLQKRGLTIYELQTSGSTLLTGHSSVRTMGQVNAVWRANFYRRLGAMLAAGVTAERSIRVLKQQAGKTWETSLLEGIGKRLAEGKPLSQALSVSSPKFSAFEKAMLAVGERTGNYVGPLEDVAGVMERGLDLRSRIGSALVYPLFLLLLAPVSLIIITAVLVPNIAPLFEGSSTSAPLVIRIMATAHQWFNSSPIFASSLLAAPLVLLAAVLMRSGAMQTLKSVALKLPMVSGISILLASVHHCRILAAMIRSGAPLQDALATLELAAWDATSARKISDVRRAVSAGRPLSAALAKEALLVAGTTDLVAVGEETNKLGEMLLHASTTQEKLAHARIERLMVLLVPVLTLSTGILIGGIIVSVMSALLSINQLAAQ